MDNHQTEWSPEEVKYLLDHLKELGAKAVGEYLGRTTRAVHAKTLKLSAQVVKRSDTKYAEDSLRAQVAESRNMGEICDKLGINHAGTSYITLLKYIKMFSIDTSHFVRRERSAEHIEKRMVEGSTLSRTSLKKYLYKAGLKKRECELCGQGEMWKGRQMSLILDHKNGVHNDHRYENLRIVCPNCNATLDTHCGKNRREAAKQKKLEAELDKPRRNAVKKENLKEMGLRSRKVQDRPDRATLEAMVKEHGYSAVGRMFGVSDNAIRKWLWQ